MAAKTLKESISQVEIEKRIKQAVVLGPTYELVQRLEKAASEIEQRLIIELKDYFSHEVMRLQNRQEDINIEVTAIQLFELVFKNISAVGGGK